MRVSFMGGIIFKQKDQQLVYGLLPSSLLGFWTFLCLDKIGGAQNEKMC